MPVLALLALCFGAMSSAYAREYILARAPQRSAVLMTKNWNAFVDALCKESGVRIRLKLYDDRNTFERDLMQGKPDFAFGNPAYLVIANRKHGYLPVVRSSKKLLKGILVVRRDSGINLLSELEGKKIVFPGRNAFAASRYLRGLLDESGLVYTPVYVNGHDNVYRNVANGSFSAGGGVYRTLEIERAPLKSQLRVLYETPGVNPHPLIVHPDVPTAIMQRVREAVLRMGNSPGGQALLKQVNMENPVMADLDRDYGAIRKLSMKVYSDLLE